LEPRYTMTKLLRDLRIKAKLALAFGIVAAVTLLSVIIVVVSHLYANQTISTTADVRVPTALLADQAQANLLKMQADVNGYLALGDAQYRDSYRRDNLAFSANLQQLDALGSKLSPANQEKLAELKANYTAWAGYPDRLFALRDDQLAREPAYNLLVTQGVKLAGTVLIDAGKLIDDQAQRTPSSQTVSQLADMARFQGSFSAMLSGLRGYVTTRNRIFRSEYEANYDLNQIAWDRLSADAQNLDSAQQTILKDIQDKRTAFLALPDQMFTILEGDHYREDLYLFRTKALPTSATMLTDLADLTSSQQTQLITDLDLGRHGLEQSNLLTLILGSLAVLIALAVGYMLNRWIAGPVRRLTNVAEQVKAGDLDVQAKVESADEIGILAGTFNRMTAQLRQTLHQIRREKKRADDLLNVVIPIGVQLSDEKDFNRLLETMVLEAKSFCHARTGVLYLRTVENCLQYVIVHDDGAQVALGGTTGRQISFQPLPLADGAGDGPATDHGPTRVSVAPLSLAVRAARLGASINVPAAVQLESFDYADSGLPASVAEPSASCLAIPLKNAAGEVTGVLELAGAQDPESGDPIPFDVNLQQMMESFSSLAVAALEAYIREQGLKHEIQQLRIEIDEVKRQQQVREIVETDFFQDLQLKARAMRGRRDTDKPETGAEQAA
jgi:HAMP domain-containing protein/CHASE3 domain sensor protein